VVILEKREGQGKEEKPEHREEPKILVSADERIDQAGEQAADRLGQHHAEIREGRKVVPALGIAARERDEQVIGGVVDRIGNREEQVEREADEDVFRRHVVIGDREKKRAR